MASKKNKKKKKKRLKLKITIFLIIVLLTVVALAIHVLHEPIKNIYVTGNKILSDKEIIKLSELGDYPPYINTYFTDVESNIKENIYVKNVTVKRKLNGKVYIDLEEYKPICIYNDKLILSSKEKVDNIYNINYVPYVINDIDKLYDKFVEKFSLINDDILVKISHIEYAPNDVDNERFLLYMVDKNYTYITLSKITKLNKYNSIVTELEGKKGIIYLDSGDYVEIKG